ncbi:MAG: N-acetylmuramoyl-L-alanine amidase [Chloroflexia bacterium]
MSSDRFYFAIALVALLVLGAGSASLMSPAQNGVDKLAVYTPTPPRAPFSTTTGTDASLFVPTSAPQPSVTPIEVPSPLVVITPTVAIALQVPTPTLPPPTQNPTEPSRQPTAVVQADIQPQSVNATAIPIPPPAPERMGGPVTDPNNHPGPRWVTLQVGHLRNQNLPNELRHLVPNTGAFAAGVSEVELNEAVAQETARFLIERGYNVDLLDATVPIGYTTDLLIAIHADGNIYSSVRGFKAVAPWNSVPASDDFVGFLYEEYGKATGLPTDAMTSVAMANYYAFNPWRYRHAVTPNVPSALLEMGFVTNPEDRKVLTLEQDSIAWGITNAVDRYFRSGKAGSVPTAYPSFTPTNTPTSTPSNTPTSTSTPTVTPTITPIPTDTLTPVPTEFMVGATETALLITPSPSIPPTLTPVLPQPTRTPVPTKTPIPTPTPLQGIITADGRWLPPLSPSGRSRLPQPGSDAPPVLLSQDTENIDMRAHGREQEQVWQQFYIPELGRSVWRKATLRQVRH